MLMMTANPAPRLSPRRSISRCWMSPRRWTTTSFLKSISPMLAYTAGTLVKTGTPARVKNHFYKTIQPNKRMATGRGKRKNHYQWDWRGRQGQQELREVRQEEMLRIGEDSDEFQMSYLCRWMLDRGMFITQTAFDNLGIPARRLCGAGTRVPSSSGLTLPARLTPRLSPWCGSTGIPR